VAARNAHGIREWCNGSVKKPVRLRERERDPEVTDMAEVRVDLMDVSHLLDGLHRQRKPLVQAVQAVAEALH